MFAKSFDMTNLDTNKKTTGRLTKNEIEIYRGLFSMTTDDYRLGNVTIIHADTDEKFRLLSGAGWGLMLGPIGMLAGARKKRTALFVVIAGGNSYMAEVSQKDDPRTFARMIALSHNP